MKTTIGPNKGNFYGKIVVEIVFLFLFCYFAYVAFHKEIHRPFMEITTGRYGAIMFLILTVGLMNNIRKVPFCVIIDDELKTLQVKYLLTGTRLIRLEEIKAYSNTTMKSTLASCLGIFVHLTNGQKFLASDINLEDYWPIELFLMNLKVKNLGEERFTLY
jgi:hypothetical protein